MMEKGRIEFNDPTFREHPQKGLKPLSLEEKREQVRKGNPNGVRYNNPTAKIVSEFTAELKQLRRITAFYGIEIMPDGSFMSPRITQNEVDVKELREFVGAMNSIGIEEWYGRWQKDGTFAFFDHDHHLIASGTDPSDAWRKMNAGEGE